MAQTFLSVHEGYYTLIDVLHELVFIQHWTTFMAFFSMADLRFFCHFYFIILYKSIFMFRKKIRLHLQKFSLYKDFYFDHVQRLNFYLFIFA